MGCNASHDRADPHAWNVEHDCPSQAGRIVVVTGANSGIGRKTVEYMLLKGATVVMACRDTSSAEKASKKILKSLRKREDEIGKAHRTTGDDSGHNSDNEGAVKPPEVRSYADAVREGVAGNVTVPAKDRLFIEKLDLCSFASIREFAQRLERREGAFTLGRIDTLILNAGISNLSKLHRTEDGFEKQWQTNFLGHFLLVGELQTALRRSTNQPVVVPVSSISAHQSHLTQDSAFDFKFDKEWHGKYSDETVYADTKLAATLFATELKNRHGDWLRVIPCHPGACKTHLLRHSAKYSLIKPKCEPASQGGMLEMRAATDFSLPNGSYVGTGGGKKGGPVIEDPGHEAVDPATARALWTAAEQAVGITY